LAIAVTITAPLDAATYDQMIGYHAPALRQQAGFQFHYAQPTPGGWTVTEIWDSQAAYSAWFDATVKANLPVGVEAQVTLVHNTVAH
jgi:heme-degrading monooxygenase HmoA